MGTGMLLRVVALVLFIIAALPVPTRVNLLAAGLAFYTAADLIG